MKSHWLSTNKNHSLYEAKGFFSHSVCWNNMFQPSHRSSGCLVSTENRDSPQISHSANYYEWRRRASQTFSAQKDAKLDIISKKESHLSMALALLLPDLATSGRAMEMLDRYLPSECAGGHAFYVTLPLLSPKHFSYFHWHLPQGHWSKAREED